jgi:GT2 family glycosyltransferase
MSDKSPTVSVVVLSYDRPAMLVEALRSVAAQTFAPLEIILVDNQSPASDEVARVAARFPSVKLIRNRDNLGFAAGMNRGIEEASGDYIYLTEDDITLERDCIRHLVEYADRNMGDLLASSLMYNRAAGTIRCAGGEVSLGGVYRRMTYGEGVRDAGQYAQPFDVAYVDGAAVFARADFLRGTGGFREEFFMYGDAVELCVRAAKAGARMTVVPAAKVYHFEPPPRANHSPLFDFHRYKNLFSLYLLHARARHLPEFFARYALLALVRASLGRGGNARALLKALLWTARRTPSLLRERRGARQAALRVVDAGGRITQCKPPSEIEEVIRT